MSSNLRVTSVVRDSAARLVVAGAGYAIARMALTVRRSQDQQRINYRGRQVSLAGGPAVTLAASLTAAAGAARRGRRDIASAVLSAGLTAGVVGRYDDVVGSSHGSAKGLRGHLGALRQGRLTTGVVKLAGLSLAGVAAAAALPSRHRGAARVADVALGAGLIAGSANLVNLLDLRPGRALKAALVASALLAAVPIRSTAIRSTAIRSTAIRSTAIRSAAGPYAVARRPVGARRDGVELAGPIGAMLAVLPEDLGERVMLGDAGANAVGAVLGVAAAARTGLVGRAVAVAGLVALTLASERWSFTAVIESTPILHRADRMGRHLADRNSMITGAVRSPATQVIMYP